MFHQFLIDVEWIFCSLGKKQILSQFHVQDQEQNLPEGIRFLRPRGLALSSVLVLLTIYDPSMHSLYPISNYVLLLKFSQAGEDSLRRSGLGYTIIRPGPLKVKMFALSYNQKLIVVKFYKFDWCNGRLTKWEPLALNDLQCFTAQTHKA